MQSGRTRTASEVPKHAIPRVFSARLDCFPTLSHVLCPWRILNSLIQGSFPGYLKNDSAQICTTSLNNVMIVIPQPNYRARETVVIAQRAQARCAQQKISASRSGTERQPPRGEHPEEVSA